MGFRKPEPSSQRCATFHIGPRARWAGVIQCRLGRLRPPESQTPAFPKTKTPHIEVSGLWVTRPAQGEANDRHPQGRSPRPRAGMRQRKWGGSERRPDDYWISSHRGAVFWWKPLADGTRARCPAHRAGHGPSRSILSLFYFRNPLEG